MFMDDEKEDNARDMPFLYIGGLWGLLPLASKRGKTRAYYFQFQTGMCAKWRGANIALQSLLITFSVFNWNGKPKRFFFQKMNENR
jgi:hypothetical protein